MSKWAATPDLAINIAEIILHYKPNYVVEVGSGTSSLIAGYCVEKNGKGKVQSFDHDEAFGNVTRQLIQQHKLHTFCEVQHAPLVSHTLKGKEWTWYDLQFFNPPQKIDLLIVDGPPVKTQKKARFPALPFLYEHLSDDAIIILDDASRESEAAVLKDWLAMYPEFTLDLKCSQKGIAILKRNAS